MKGHFVELSKGRSLKVSTDEMELWQEERKDRKEWSLQIEDTEACLWFGVDEVKCCECLESTRMCKVAA